MSRTEAAMRQAGALVVLAAASALVRQLPVAHHAVLLALHVVLLLGCAAVQLAPAHRAVAGLARRAAEAARRTVAAWLRWVGFAGVLLYALFVVAGDVRREEASLHVGFLLFLIFLAAVWAVFLSMITGRPAAAEDELDGGEFNAMDASICY